MSAFVGYVCWREGDLADVLFADAGAHGQLQGVFAATHRPIPAVRDAGGLAAPVGDAAVDALRFLTAPVPGTDPVVIPVLGDPGTGKSHLVRWIWTRLEPRSADDFVVIYVPRVRTSFSGVVELLLKKALEDEDADVREMAASVVNYSADLASQDVAAVAARLKADMYGVLQRPRSDAPPALLKDLGTIVIEGGEVIDYFASPASAIGRRAMRFVDRGEDAGELPDAAFTLDELESFNELGRLRPSNPFVNAVRRLVSDRAYGDLDQAMRLLNWALDQAVAEQMATGGHGRPTLNVVFRRLRESLKRSGRELVILIEDLKLLHGVERTFDALEPLMGKEHFDFVANVCLGEDVIGELCRDAAPEPLPRFVVPDDHFERHVPGAIPVLDIVNRVGNVIGPVDDLRLEALLETALRHHATANPLGVVTFSREKAPVLVACRRVDPVTLPGVLDGAVEHPPGEVKTLEPRTVRERLHGKAKALGVAVEAADLAPCDTPRISRRIERVT